jgi:glycosyltransferase involved in cell wall biosynthesis
MNKRISFFLPDLRGGGAERVFVTLANYLSSQGYEIEVILLKKQGDLIAVCDDNITIIDLKCQNIRQCILPLRNYITLNKPDCLLVGMWPLTVYAVLANLLATNKSKIIVTDHSILSKSGPAKNTLTKLFIRSSIGLFYRLAFACVGVSKGVSEDISKLGGGIKNITTIYNPIYLSKDTLEQKRLLKEPYIISIGSFKPVKDFFTLIKAFHSFKTHTNNNIKLVILGEGHLRYEMQTLINQLNIQDIVLMPGFFDKPFQWYQHADLFVLSSINEGFGNVIVEAMSCGIPVVSTDCESGPREILENGKYGKLVPVGDVQALANAMEESLTVKHDKELLKQRAADFSVDKIAKQYLDIMFPERVTHD